MVIVQVLVLPIIAWSTPGLLLLVTLNYFKYTPPTQYTAAMATRLAYMPKQLSVIDTKVDDIFPLNLT